MSRSRRTGRASAIRVLVATEAAIEKLGARGISIEEALQLPGNRHDTIRNRGQAGRRARRRLLIGRTDGGRTLTFVVEQTADPTTWLIVTGWPATSGESRILGD